MDSRIITRQEGIFFYCGVGLNLMLFRPFWAICDLSPRHPGMFLACFWCLLGLSCGLVCVFWPLSSLSLFLFPFSSFFLVISLRFEVSGLTNFKVPADFGWHFLCSRNFVPGATPWFFRVFFVPHWHLTSARQKIPWKIRFLENTTSPLLLLLLLLPFFFFSDVPKRNFEKSAGKRMAPPWWPHLYPIPLTVLPWTPCPPFRILIFI